MLKTLAAITPAAFQSYLFLLSAKEPIRRDYTDLFTLMFEEVQKYAMFTIDPEGKIVSWNPASKHLFGYTANEAIGQPLSFLFPDMAKNGHLKKDVEMALKKGQFEHTEEVIDKDKRKRAIRCVVTALWGSDKKLMGFSKLLFDVTQEIEAEKKREEFISLAGHELKNPITSIKAYLQLLQLKLSKKGDTELRPIIGKALSQVDKLTDLVKDILDSSKIAIGKLPFHDTNTIFVDEFLTEIIESVQIGYPDYVIILAKAPHLSLKNIDKERLGQVLINLLQNAIKYSPTNKKITISAEKREEVVTVLVKDRGIGVPKNEQQKIFEKFYRGNEAKKVESGLGLGLHVAQEIISHYNGTIAVESQKGKGSTFSIQLPLIG